MLALDTAAAIGALAGVFIGGVFVVAGASKVAQGARWPTQAAGMGVPIWLARIVPWWEIVVGALTTVGVLSPWPAVAVVITLVAFVVLIAVQLRQGRHPPCACFGTWSTEPLGARHLWRNAAFVAVAVVAIALSS